MTALAAAVAWTHPPPGTTALASLSQANCVSDLLILVPTGTAGPSAEHQRLEVDSLWSTRAITDLVGWFEKTGSDHLLLCLSPALELPEASIRRLLACAQDAGAALSYGDHFDRKADGSCELHPLIDYQIGSLRDDFDFGQLLLLSGKHLSGQAKRLAADHPDLIHAGWYDLRLRLSEKGPVVHLPEPVGGVLPRDQNAGAETHFAYVDPRNRDYQLEMERVATAHLRRMGAFLDPPKKALVEASSPFAVEASVIIPVKNRKRTIAGAVESALSQQAPFGFNVIVVDNHSDDGTGEVLAEIAARDPRLMHLIPTRKDLGIGGCWNEALYSSACGRYAVQLDSDDLYAGPDVLGKVVAAFEAEPVAMVIGAYTIVDFDLNPVPPGLIDHREWSDENGHNNALRIHGLGAPRAFHVPSLREIGFPNVSYGEDYAVALQLTRLYPLGRIYDSLYWCRRWEDNTDHALPLTIANHHAAYKDRLRTIEMAARTP